MYKAVTILNPKFRILQLLVDDWNAKVGSHLLYGAHPNYRLSVSDLPSVARWQALLSSLMALNSWWMSCASWVVNVPSLVGRTRQLLCFLELNRGSNGLVDSHYL